MGDIIDGNLSGDFIKRLINNKGETEEFVGGIIGGLIGFVIGFRFLSEKIGQGIFKILIKRESFLEKHREIYFLHKDRIDEVISKSNSANSPYQEASASALETHFPKGKQNLNNVLLLKDIRSKCEQWMQRSDMPKDVLQQLKEWIGVIRRI